MNKHEELACKYFTDGYNCAQSVFAAFHKEMGLSESTALKMSSAFGGGMGCGSICGAVSAMVMLAGLKSSKGINLLPETNKKERINYTYSKLTDDGLEKLFDIKNITWVSDKKTVKDGMFLVTSKSYSDSVKGNQLLYVKDGRKIVVDKNYDYDIVGIINNKLCYYKNKYNYGTYDENLKTFYLYDGKKSIKVFDLDLGFFEDIIGYEYDGGLVIEVAYESSTRLYKYDGKEVIVLDTPEHFYSIMGLDIIDNKAYIKYSEGEESMVALGTIIDLD